jgi:DNA-binding NtrC family response regulator
VTQLSPETVEIFAKYHWPGNVRELRNAIERAMILQDEGYIDEQVFPLRISAFGVDSKRLLPDARLSIPSQGIDLYEVEADLIRQALVKAGGNQTQASRFLSITRDTLRYKMKKYGLGKHRGEPLQHTHQ